MKKQMMACSLTALLWAVPSVAGEKTWTLDGEFDTGVLDSVNHDAPNNDQLQLNTSSSTEPYIWIANYAQDTVTKMDTRTGKQVAKYHSVLMTNWDGTVPTVAEPEHRLQLSVAHRGGRRRQRVRRQPRHLAATPPRSPSTPAR